MYARLKPRGMWYKLSTDLTPVLCLYMYSRIARELLGEQQRRSPGF